MLQPLFVLQGIGLHAAPCVALETDSLFFIAGSKTVQSLGTEGHNEVAASLGWPGRARTGREITCQRGTAALCEHVCMNELNCSCLWVWHHFTIRSSFLFFCHYGSLCRILRSEKHKTLFQNLRFLARTVEVEDFTPKLQVVCASTLKWFYLFSSSSFLPAWKNLSHFHQTHFYTNICCCITYFKLATRGERYWEFGYRSDTK